MKHLAFLIIMMISTSGIAGCTDPLIVGPPAPAIISDPVVTNPEIITPGDKVSNVCIMVWDAKKNIEVKKCKNLIIRQKHDGTKIP